MISAGLLGQNARNLFGFSKSNDIQVIHNTKSIALPWTGGINNALVSTIDLDLDGIDDLVIFDSRQWMTKSPREPSSFRLSGRSGF